MLLLLLLGQCGDRYVAAAVSGLRREIQSCSHSILAGMAFFVAVAAQIFVLIAPLWTRLLPTFVTLLGFVL